MNSRPVRYAVSPSTEPTERSTLRVMITTALAGREQQQDRRRQQQVAPAVGAEQEARALDGAAAMTTRRAPARIDASRDRTTRVEGAACRGLLARRDELGVGVLGLPAARSCVAVSIMRATSRVWVAARITFSGVASSRGMSAVRRPSQTTRTRSAMPRTSGSSEEIIRIAMPLAGQLGEQPVHLGLGADVDAAGGLVDDQQPRLGGQPLGDDDLLLVAAAHRGGVHVERVGLHLEASRPTGADGLALRALGEEADPGQAGCGSPRRRCGRPTRR